MTPSGGSDIAIKVGEYDGQIGTIDEVWLGFEDHGLLTFHLGFVFGAGGMHQGTGHLVLGADPWPKAGPFLARVVKMIGNLAAAKGQRVIVLRKDRASGIDGIVPLAGGEPLIFQEAFADDA